MFCLETRGLVYRYSDDAAVLGGIDLQVPEGSIYGFLGPNGAGKTTTLRLILGLLRNQQGSITIFGRNFARDRIGILEQVGSLIESPSLYDHLTAVENLRLLQTIYRCPKNRIDEVLQLVGLSGTGKKRAREFSLGMKQRLSIAIALLHRPALLILDEPTNGLDPNGIIEMRQLLARLNRDEGVTIVISSHLLAEIERLVTHLGIIDRGRMLFQGAMGELKERQQQVLSIWIGTSDDERALALLRDRIDKVRLSDGRLVLPPLTQAEVEEVNRLLVESGIGVYEIRAVRNDLETIFMDMVGAVMQ